MRHEAIATVLMLAFAATASAQGGRDAETVSRKGRTVVQFEDDAVKLVVGYRHANQHYQDSGWILLDTCWQAKKGALNVNREDISLVLPGGERVPLPSQKKVTQGFPDLRRFVMEVNVNRDPIEGYFPHRNRTEPIRLFTIPGEGIVLDEFGGGPSTMLFGDLLFPSPVPAGSFPAGEYVLEVRNKDLNVRLPFTLPAPPLEKRDKDGKTVPW